MDVKVNALCVRTVDYRESDRLLTLCTLEKGKLLAKITGCKAPKSKLRFAASPLCFGEYLLNEKGGRYSVIGCTAYDNFYEISYDLKKYYGAFVALECAEKLTVENDVEGTRGITMLTISAIKDLCYGDTDALIIVAKFLMSALSNIGYGINLDNCAASGAPLEGSTYFDFTISGVVLKSRRTADAVALADGGLQFLRALQGGDAKPYMAAAPQAVAFLGETLSRLSGARLLNVSSFLDVK